MHCVICFVYVLLCLYEQVITAVTVTDEDYDDINKQVEYYIEPSAHAYLFRLNSSGQTCDVILNDQLDADQTANFSISSVVYSINVSRTFIFTLCAINNPYSLYCVTVTDMFAVTTSAYYYYVFIMHKYTIHACYTNGGRWIASIRYVV